MRNEQRAFGRWIAYDQSTPRMRSTCFALALSVASPLLSEANAAFAQPVVPKQCVSVARDPDDGVRALATRIERLFEATPSVRVVADPRTRAILRGEVTDDSSLSTVISARRALALSDTDTTALDTIANALGCASITVVASTPSGFALRRYDVIARQYDTSTEATQWTEDTLRTRLRIPSPSSSAAPSDASTTRPTSSTANTEASHAIPATPTTAVSTNIPSNRTAPRSAHRTDPRVTTQPDPLPNNTSSRSTPIWAWLIAGVAGAGLAGAFIAAQSIGPSVPRVRVSGPQMAP